MAKRGRPSAERRSSVSGARRAATGRGGSRGLSKASDNRPFASEWSGSAAQVPPGRVLRSPSREWPTGRCGSSIGRGPAGHRPIPIAPFSGGEWLRRRAGARARVARRARAWGFARRSGGCRSRHARARRRRRAAGGGRQDESDRDEDAGQHSCASFLGMYRGFGGIVAVSALPSRCQRTARRCRPIAGP